jgi:anti-sigma factor RsiW
MMEHPGRDTLLAHVDRELTEHEERRVAGHLAGCATCDAAVSELRSDVLLFAGTLHALDADEPVHWAQHSAGTPAAAGDALPLRSHQARPPGRGSGRSDALRWAAGILLFAGVTAGAAMVGIRVLSDTSEPATMTDQSATPGPDVAAVIAVPVNGALRVAVTGAGTGSRLFVALGDRTVATVAVEGAGSPRFTAVDGRVDVDLRGASATLRLTLPRTLREGTVTADGVTLVTVDRARVSPVEASGAGIPLDTVELPRME